MQPYLLCIKPVPKQVLISLGFSLTMLKSKNGQVIKLNSHNTLFFLPQGTHNVKWEYQKDGSVDNFDDAAYIDNILITDPSDVSA